mmetsp:Transcript_63980/g.171950  ORF Transcript_63980/g.171950 Transcript_63980/m.171950 type:complete len:102 (+) Transcript_63980:1-306(+)
MPGQHMQQMQHQQQQQQQMPWAPVGQATGFAGGEQPGPPSPGQTQFSDLVSTFHQKNSANSAAPAPYAAGGPASGGAVPAPMPQAAAPSGNGSGNPFDMFG